MANCNLINSVIDLGLQMAAELGTTKSKFTLESVDQMRTHVRKDHWELITELERSDETGNAIANCLVRNLFQRAFSNVSKAWISASDEITIILKNDVTIKIKNPAQRVQEELIW